MGHILSFRKKSKRGSAVLFSLVIPLLMLGAEPSFASTPLTTSAPRCREVEGQNKFYAVTGEILRKGTGDNQRNVQTSAILTMNCDKGAVLTVERNIVGYPKEWTDRFPTSAWRGKIIVSMSYDTQSCLYEYDPLNPSAGFTFRASGGIGSCTLPQASNGILTIGEGDDSDPDKGYVVIMRAEAFRLELRSDDDGAEEIDFGPYIVGHTVTIPTSSREFGGINLKLSTNPNPCSASSAFEFSYPKDALVFKRAIGASSNRVVNETLSFRIGVKYNRLETSSTCNRKIEPKVTFSLGAGQGELLDDNIHIDLKDVGLLLSLQASSDYKAYKDVVFGKATSLADIPVDKHRVMRYTNFVAKLTRNPQRRLTPGAFNQIVLAEIEYD